MSNKPIILVIDDEKSICRLLRIALEVEGYSVNEANSGLEGLYQAANCRPDVIVLDLGLPDINGLEVLQRLREWNQTPVLVLSVKQEVDDKVATLDMGADDYLTKPFHTAELAARLRAIRRHSQREADGPVLNLGQLCIDLLARTATLKGKELHLTPTEFTLLRVLMQHAGKIVTHRQLLREVWGPNAEEQSQYLRVYMAHLRKKVETSQPASLHIKNEPGIGYRLVEKDARDE
jgi:two-component system KDP operon response regulator KdpE